jgi:2-polyprenyl-6-methoxyphenol hydroxylase-like FAD-dependent oxidoreductase
MNVLISGAGIAGTAAALFLQKFGIAPTIIDKADAFQKLGYILSLKSFGLQLMDELGLLDELKQRGLPYSSIRLYRADEGLLQEFHQDIVDRITHGEIFVYRADLHEVLYNAADRLIGIHFGIQIRAIEQNHEYVRVVFSDGAEKSFDAVIISEGLRSTTREMLWHENGVEPFEVIYTATTIDHRHAFNRSSMNTYFGVNKSLLCFPVTDERLVFQAYLRGRLPEGIDNQQMQQLLLRAFADFTPGVTDLLHAMKPENYVFRDNVAMIALPALHKGRVALLGDAGYCPTFLSGMGASLALLGARVVSQSLQQSRSDPGQGLSAYSTAMQGPVQHFQKNARRNALLVVEQNRLRLALSNWLVQHMPPTITARRVGKQFLKEKAALAQLKV